MISTALALQEATGNAVIELSSMLKASKLHNNRHTMSEDEFAQSLFEYAAHLASVTATMVTEAILTETELDNLLATIKEMEAMGKDID